MTFIVCILLLGTTSLSIRTLLDYSPRVPRRDPGTVLILPGKGARS